MTEPRLTVDTINSDQLDALQADRYELATLRETHDRLWSEFGKERDRAEKAEAELLEWKKLLQKSREMTAAHWSAIERVRKYAADLGRAGWSQAAVARRILAALDEPKEPDADLIGTVRTFAGLYRSAEGDVSRVIELYERWTAAGPPPIGTPMARWWDARLVELRAALNPPKEPTP